jgi:hypothetical protein
MTESEAKTKWCPLIRVGVQKENGAVACNASVQYRNPDNCRCIASACMFWRQQIPAHRETKNHVATEAIGFCGVAGRPWNP